MNQTPTARTENLAYALDSWNNNILIQDKLPPRNKSGLKSYTKDFGKTAREFNLIDVTFVDAIAAYRSLPYSFPEFALFEIPSNLKHYVEMLNEKTSAIATMLDYALKDGKPELIYQEKHPYARQSELLLTYREVALELFPKVNRLNHLFPSVAVAWGCLLVGEIRFMLFDSGFSEAMCGDLLPSTGVEKQKIPKRQIEQQVSDSVDFLQSKIKNKTQSLIPIGTDPHVIFWGEVKQLTNHKKKSKQSQNVERLYQKIKTLKQTIKNDPKCQFHWVDQRIFERH